MILEIGRKYLRDFYNNNLAQAVKEKDGVMWDNETIKKAFKFGTGTRKDFEKYRKNNAKHCIFVEI